VGEKGVSGAEWATVLSTAASALGGILISNRLTVYRIEQLEKKVEKHNRLAERVTLAEEKIKVANHRIEDLEGRK
jgi:hypothetical protein